MSKDYDHVNLSVDLAEGGAVVTARQVDSSTGRIVRESRAVAAGDGFLLNTRVRKAIKVLVEAEFPRKPKIEAPNPTRALAGIGD